MLKLTTPCFVEGGWIPDYNAGFGEDQSPEFHIEGIAPKAETMVITLDDLGHPLEPGYNHWVAWNIKPADCTEHTLDGKADKNRIKFNRTFVMAITDETSFPATGTFDHVKLEMFYCMVIKILRKIVAVFKDNCYHILVRAQGSFTPGAVWGKTGRLWTVVACLFSLVRDNSNIKGSGIKESDGIYVTLFDSGALLNLT